MIFRQENTIQEQYLQNEKLFQEQIEEIGLKVNNGEEFQIDKKQIYVILNKILAYPSTQEAEDHRKANQLGCLDLERKRKEYNRISEHADNLENVQNLENTQNIENLRNMEAIKGNFCSCCGFILQQDQLSVCENDFQNIKNLGISTFVFFRTIINASILLVIMFFVFSLYSMITNLTSSEIETNGTASKAALDFMSISLGSKELYASDEKRFLYVVGAWIGAGMLIIWAFAIVALKYYQKQNEINLLLQNKTVSQYSLVIEKMPTDMTQEQVQQQFNKYLQSLKEKEIFHIDKLQVQKYNQGKPFYLHEQQFKSQQLSKMLQLNERYKDRFARWILQRRFKDTFRTDDKTRQKIYNQYHAMIEDKNRLCQEIVQKIKEEYKKKHKSNKTTAFITFSSNHEKNLILDYNPSDMLSVLKDFIPFLKSQNRFCIQRNGVKHNLKIYPAPDPQDIIWPNIGVRNCDKISRKILTYSITLLILAISFVIVYALSSFQAESGINVYISILISLSICLINVLIIRNYLPIVEVIKHLTKLERDYTMTNLQMSLAIKSIIAQLINCIFVPIAANRFIKKNIYNRNGLVQDIFILAITNAFVPPLIKIIDPYYYIMKIIGYVRKQPIQKIMMNQNDLNQLFQKPEFEVGYEYIYIVNLFIFTCFFVSLQPIIPIFSILGYFLMYFAQKYSIYKRCQRPVPGTKIINTTMAQILNFGPLAYTLGSFTWSNFLSDKQFAYSIPPNMLALSISVVIFFIPYESIFRKVFKHKRMPQVFYRDNKIFFTSQYDRLNPSTFQAGIKDYKQFLETKKKELQKQKEEVKNKLNIDLQHTVRPNFLRQSGNNFFMRSDNNQMLYNNLMHKQSQHIVTTQMVAQFLRPSDQQRNYLYKSNYRRKLPTPKIKKQISQFNPNHLQKREDGGAIDQEHQAGINHVKNATSIKLQKTQSYFIPKKQIDKSTEQKYFQNISNANSFLLHASRQADKSGQASQKLDNGGQAKIFKQSRRRSVHQPNEILSVTRQLKKQQHQSDITMKIKHNKIQNSGLKEQASLNMAKKYTFRESMVKSLCSSIKNKEDVMYNNNRFSIRIQNIFPLSLQQAEGEIDFLPGESQVKFYDLRQLQ